MSTDGIVLRSIGVSDEVLHMRNAESIPPNELSNSRGPPGSASPGGTPARRRPAAAAAGSDPHCPGTEHFDALR